MWQQSDVRMAMNSENINSGSLISNATCHISDNVPSITRKPLKLKF